jgi:hypothetical protein
VPALTAAMEALLMIDPPPRSLRADDHPEEVDVHDAREVLEVVRQEPFEIAADTGVVEHDVQAPEAVDGKVHQCLHLVRIAHIGLLEGGRITDASGGLLTLVHVDIRDDDVRSFHHQHLGGRPTDAAGTTGHDRHLPGEFLRRHGATIRSRRPSLQLREHRAPGRTGRRRLGACLAKHRVEVAWPRRVQRVTLRLVAMTATVDLSQITASTLGVGQALPTPQVRVVQESPSSSVRYPIPHTSFLRWN